MADVVLIGASLPALAAATWLAQTGVGVVVLERRASLETTPFARGPGVLHGGLPEHPWRLVSSLGPVQAARLHRYGIEGLDLLGSLAPISRTGSVWAATESEREPKEIAQSVAALHTMGLPADAWTGAQVDAATGGAGFHAGLWRPDEGLCSPPDVLASVLSHARAAGVQVRFGATVTGVSGRDGAFEVLAGDATCRAEIVVFAGEADSKHLDPFFADCLFPVREQAVAFSSPLRLRVGLRAAFGWTQAWTRDDGTLAIAGSRWASDHLEEGETDDTVTTTPVQSKLDGTARRFFPAVGAPVARWSWIQGHTCDGMALVGPLPGDPRLIALTGFGGCEAGLGVRSARAIVDGLLNGSADGVPTGFAPSRLIA